MDFGPCRKIVVFSIAFRAVEKTQKSSRGAKKGGWPKLPERGWSWGGVGFAILVGSLLVNHSISVSQTYVKTVYIIMEAIKYIRHTVAQSAVADFH